MDSKAYQDDALKLFDEGFNCAQSVFAAFAPAFGLKRDHALRIASAFGGGMNIGSTCGALTGAMMVLGLAAGFHAYDPQIKDSFAGLNRDLIKRFQEEAGHIDCRDILQIDPTDARQKQAAREAGVLAERCPRCVWIATGNVLSMLQELDIV